MRALRVLIAVAAVGLVTAPAAHATHGKLTGPDYPSYSSCSSNQIKFLEKAFFEAYRQVTLGDQVLDYIASRPAADRAELWNRDMELGLVLVPSPRRYFGPFNSDRFHKVRVAVEEARRRFLGQGDVARRGGVQRIKSIRCYEKKCAKDASAYHAVLSFIVTCQKFWRGDEDADLENKARLLAHEVYHWVRLDDGSYLTDNHGGGTNPYYGMDDIRYLAENKPGWAIRNNDSYAYFGRYVNDTRQPRFTAVAADKETTASGALLSDLTLAQLRSKQQELSASYMYLDDVETYLRDGERRYTALWRVGCEPPVGTCAEPVGSLIARPRTAFVADFSARKATEDLIDVEVYYENGDWVLLGVYRPRKPGAIGKGGIVSKASWKALNDKNDEFKQNAYLIDVEAYGGEPDGSYVGVWAAGKRETRLRRNAFLSTLDTQVSVNSSSMQLVDMELLEGENWIALWHPAATGRNRVGWRTWNGFKAAVDALLGTRTIIDVEEYSTLATQVLTSVPAGFAKG